MNGQAFLLHMKNEMKKNDFIFTISPILKDRGYKKRGSYWYFYDNNKKLILCINLQGSQWNKDSYYINIGIADIKEGQLYPSLLNWTWRHRCRGEQGEVNIDTKVFVQSIDTYFSEYLEAKTPSDFYNKYNATFISNQYWI